MLGEIETAIKKYLDGIMADPKRTAIQSAHKALSVPQIDVITSGGKCQKTGQRYELVTAIYVVVTFQHLRSEQDRRHGIYPIVEGILAHLARRTFGLAITGLIPKSADNITTVDEAKEGKVLFQLVFETSFPLPPPVEEGKPGEDDLLRIGLNYYLQPSDKGPEAEPDASDLLTLRD